MIVYEWVIETLDEHDDIQEVTHADRCLDALRIANKIHAEGHKVEVALVRDRGNEVDGLQNRQWAYLETDVTLPAKFDGGATIPQRFQGEVAIAKLKLR